MTRSLQRDSEESYVTQLCACSANAQAGVSLDLTPCRLAQSKALTPPKHQFVLQKEGPKSTFHMGTGALFPTSDLSATRPNNLEASRPPITSLRDQLELIVGVSPMRSFIRLVRSTMESSRSTRSRDRALSDTGVDPIKRPVEGHVEGSPVRILGLIILCPQSSL